MRIWLVTIVLLAGCSGSPSDPGPESPLYNGQGPADDDAPPAKHVPMDPVSGSLTATGVTHRHCAVIGGGGNILTAGSTWTFEVGSNATRLDLKATWDPTNPTLERLAFHLHYGDDILTTVEGAPGFMADVAVADLEPHDRRLTASIADPQCTGDPIAAKHYDDVVVALDITFHG